MLCSTARECNIIVVIGVNEIDPVLTGTIFNTNLVIDNHGNLLGKHRKLVPTLLEGMNCALSAVFGPDGRIIGEPLIDKEGIVYADVCLDDLIVPKLMHDITGHYNQFGVLSLALDRTPQKPLYEQNENAQDIEILNPTINRSEA